MGEKASYPSQICFCGTRSRGRIVGERKRFVLCFYPFFCVLGFVFIGMLALPGTYFCGSDLCIVKHSQRLPFLCLTAVSLTSRYFSSWIDKWIFPSYWQSDLILASCASAELPSQGFGESRIWWLPSPLFGWMMWQTLSSFAISPCMCCGSAQITHYTF